MKYLIDTHILIWFLEGSSSLTKNQTHTISNSDNETIVSMASLWEIAIKLSIQKLKLNSTIHQLIEKIEAERMGVLSIEKQHVLSIVSLPFHHHDPFDRLIIAQAIAEEITLITNDSKFEAYQAHGLKLGGK